MQFQLSALGQLLSLCFMRLQLPYFSGRRFSMQLQLSSSRESCTLCSYSSGVCQDLTSICFLWIGMAQCPNISEKHKYDRYHCHKNLREAKTWVFVLITFRIAKAKLIRSNKFWVTHVSHVHVRTMIHM